MGAFVFQPFDWLNGNDEGRERSITTKCFFSTLLVKIYVKFSTSKIGEIGEIRHALRRRLSLGWDQPSLFPQHTHKERKKEKKRKENIIHNVLYFTFKMKILLV